MYHREVQWQGSAGTDRAATMQVAQHITAIQQRAAMLGSGPLEWAVGARCQAREGNEGKWRRAVIEGISPSGRYLIEWLPSAREECFEVSLTHPQPSYTAAVSP